MNRSPVDQPSRSIRDTVGCAIFTLPVSLGTALISAGAALAQTAPSGAPAAPTVPAASTVAIGNLPHDLSPWGMFLSADIVVKTVVVSLIFASLVTWTVWLAKTLELLAARRATRQALQALSTAPTLEAGAAHLKPKSQIASFVTAAQTELNLSEGLFEADGIKERVISRLERLEAAYGRRMTRGTGLLATIGATAPFVGLFGTVWGIMNAFIGISKSQTTNLAVVAPGIAEALLATAIGLFAAIPAVVIYNMFARWISGYRAQLADASAEVLRLVSRDLDRQAAQSRSGKSKLPAAAE
ncbi:MAG: exbB 1 [Xanthobacteraceae bacterium]|nr:exbB 1 [Xanthobacteraceae bacterium]